MLICLGHLLAKGNNNEDGTVLVKLYDWNESVAVTKIAKSQRGANRMMDNWAKKRGDCNCLS